MIPPRACAHACAHDPPRRSSALVAASALLLTGCASDPLADQFREGSGKNYIAGDGTISEFAEPQRGEPIEFSGETVEGGTFDSADTLGEVTVVNFWYAGCAPCRVEAPHPRGGVAAVRRRAA